MKKPSHAERIAHLRGALTYLDLFQVKLALKQEARRNRAAVKLCKDGEDKLVRTLSETSDTYERLAELFDEACK